MKHAKELKIGIFVIVILTASFFLINYLRGEDIFNNEYEVVGVYGNVEGLVASAPVYVKGYKAGKVSEVNYLTAEGKFEVVCSIANEFQFPEDSKMTIYAVDIMGSRGVRIDFGESEQVAQDGARLDAVYEQGLLDGLGASIQPLIAKVENTLDSLSLMVSGVNSMLTEANVKHVSRTLANLERTMANVNGITRTIRGKSAELETFVENLAAFSGKLEGIAAKVDTTVAGVTGVVDQGTWTAIRDEWLDLERELVGPRQLRGFPEGTRVAVGESREFLYVVQAMFQALANVLEEIEEERIDGIHSGSSVNNAMWLQNRAGLRATGEMNRETWDALSRLYELFVVRRPHGIVPSLGRG